jgi:hypothetical protein
LGRDPADRAGGQHVHHLPAATFLPHHVVQPVRLTGPRSDPRLYDPIAADGPDGRDDLEALAEITVEIRDVGRDGIASEGIPSAACCSGGNEAQRGPITWRRTTSRSKVRPINSAIMSYRCRKGTVLPAFMIAIIPAWSCSTGAVISDAAAARPNPRDRAAEPSATRKRVRRVVEATDIGGFLLVELTYVSDACAIYLPEVPEW